MLTGHRIGCRRQTRGISASVCGCIGRKIWRWTAHGPRRQCNGTELAKHAQQCDIVARVTNFTFHWLFVCLHREKPAILNEFDACGKTRVVYPPRTSLAQERGSLMQQSLVEQNPVLTDADRAALDAQACRGLLRALAAQGAMGLAAAAIAGIIAGTSAGLSALAGAGAYLVPNALFALRLLVSVLKSGRASPVTFFLGEMVKLLMTALLLWLLARVAQDWLVWPAVLLGLVFTLKGYLLLLMFRKLS